MDETKPVEIKPEEKTHFFIVTEDQNVEQTLKKIIAKVITHSLTFSGKDGGYAFDFLQKIAFPVIIISDFSLPDINGIQLFDKIKEQEQLKDHYFILMTPLMDKELTLKAVQHGVNDIINTPFAIDQIITRLNNSVNYMNLFKSFKKEEQQYTELNDEFQKSINATLEALIKIQNIRMPEFAKNLPRINTVVEWIAVECGDCSKEEITDLKKAMPLTNIGKISLPESLINQPVMVNGFIKNPPMEQIPVISNEILSKIKGYEGPANILTHIWENYDGSGIPEKLQESLIPLPSRILRVVIEFFEQLPKNGNMPGKVIEFLESQANRIFDFRLIAWLDQYLAHESENSKTPREQHISKAELASGMALARNINTFSGMKIAAAGMVLDDEKIERIRTMTHEDPVIGKIYIKK
ncbi:MAG: putative two-component system, response regulator [Ignavibacteria bacterium]|nr:putative two-component system, response regulator [Ignavibacteria bacterium]